MEVGEVVLVQGSNQYKDTFSVMVEEWKDTNEFNKIVNLSIDFQGGAHFIKDALYCIFSDYEQAYLFKLTLEL